MLTDLYTSIINILENGEVPGNRKIFLFKRILCGMDGM